MVFDSAIDEKDNQDIPNTYSHSTSHLTSLILEPDHHNPYPYSTLKITTNTPILFITDPIFKEALLATSFTTISILSMMPSTLSETVIFHDLFIINLSYIMLFIISY